MAVRFTSENKPQRPDAMERLRARKHMKEHRECDSWFKYEYFPTHIGVAVSIVCLGCKKQWDVTSYNKW